MKDLHVKIPEPLYKFLAKESGKQGISMALYLTNLLREKESHQEKKVTLERQTKEPFHLEWSELSDSELEDMLASFERKYKIASETFYRLYREGKAPEAIEDRILWGGLYALKKEKDELE
jgi:hypothetical protein